MNKDENIPPVIQTALRECLMEALLEYFEEIGRDAARTNISSDDWLSRADNCSPKAARSADRRR